MKINGEKIKGQNSVTLGDEIGNELSFNNHISNICKKAGNKINAISRIQSFLDQKEKEALVNTSVYSNFNYWSFFNKEKHKQNWKKNSRTLPKITLSRSLSLYICIWRNIWNIWRSTYKIFAAFCRN